MEVKEAIKYLKLCKMEDCGYSGEEYINIINLLEELSKYKQMWGKLKETNPPAVINYITHDDDMKNIINQSKILRNTLMDTMEQKYFSKGIIK